MQFLKLSVLLALFISSTAVLAGPPPYTGKNQQGWVTIYGGGNVLSGHMNVRFNPQAGDENSTIHCGHSANSSVSCSAYDASTTTSFSCSIAPGAAIYNQAVDIVNNLTDGAYLYVSKNGNTCTSIYMAKATNFQH